MPVRPDVVTHRRVLAIALPMTVAHLTTPLLGIVDTAVVGRLGSAALIGGVALGAVAFDFLFWGFGFLRMGTVGLAAQALGRGDRLSERAVLMRALLIGLVCGLGLILLQVPIKLAVLRLAGASPEVDAALAAYFDVRIWAAPFSFINYVVAGWLTGIARTGHALVLQVVIGLLNMALTIFLVLGLGWGVAGSAAGTLMAEAVGAAAGLFACARLLGYRLAVPRVVLLDKAALKECLVLNRDIMIRTAALMLAFSFFAAQGARAGDVTLAANALLNNMVLLAAYFLDGFATAAEQVCGQAVGARNRAAFARGLRLVLLWGFGCALVASLIYLAFGPMLIDLMTTSPEVRQAARGFLIFAVLLPLVGIFAYVFDGIYIGALWSRDMRNLMLASLVIYFAAWALLRPLGNEGLWLAFLAFLAARGALQGARLPGLMRRAFPDA
ncbi:MATE family efflux transporter [Aquabacter cavernae]|uniref:MATE family efflux transporter n=1 Tax=Aquabacter cavernae TaxID=2496029 RepID=UPI000F8CAEAB|nr:MATE family efflux transporter [Aquabacter cavernae]